MTPLKIKEIMKKLLRKLRKKDELPSSSRITTETVIQHREKILSGGRRFKHPTQYTKNKLVYNAILISLSALFITIIIGWQQLYIAQNTSDFMYRVTKVIPVPVAVVDGQYAMYSDYLMLYRNSVYFYEKQHQLNYKSDDGKRQIEYIKQQSMESVITDAYVLKLSKSLNISVSDKELEALLKEQRQSSNGEISQQTYDASTLDLLGWSPTEYRYYIKNGMLRRKVAYAMDKDALKITNSLEEEINKDQKIDFNKLASTYTDKEKNKVLFGNSGWVPRNNLDGGLAVEASKLKKLEVSKIVKSTTGNGYYIVRLLDINKDNVKYEYINIPLTAFSKSLDKIISEDKVQKYISI